MHNCSDEEDEKKKIGEKKRIGRGEHTHTQKKKKKKIEVFFCFDTKFCFLEKF